MSQSRLLTSVKQFHKVLYVLLIFRHFKFRRLPLGPKILNVIRLRAFPRDKEHLSKKFEKTKLDNFHLKKIIRSFTKQTTKLELQELLNTNLIFSTNHFREEAIDKYFSIFAF